MKAKNVKKLAGAKDEEAEDAMPAAKGRVITGDKENVVDVENEDEETKGSDKKNGTLKVVPMPAPVKEKEM